MGFLFVKNILLVMKFLFLHFIDFFVSLPIFCIYKFITARKQPQRATYKLLVINDGKIYSIS